MRPAAYLFLILTPFCAVAATIHVPGDQPTIQAGIIAAAVGDTVEVACGTYYEHDIAMHTNLVLRSESGDPSCVTIDAARLGRVLETSLNCVIEGFTITHGLTSGHGGGILVQAASVTITHCSFVENEVSGFSTGGGIAFLGTALTQKVRHCSFVSNHASAGGGLGVRGVLDSIDLMMSDCAFFDNVASHAGAMYLGACSPVVSDCVFIGNHFEAIQHHWGTALFSRCLVANNGGPAFEFTLQPGDEATVSGCTVVANGTGIFVQSVSGGPLPDFDNTVIAFNEGRSCAELVGSGTQPPQFSCCDIYGNKGGDWIDRFADQANIRGNFSADPLFCDALGDLFTLSSDSPCLPGNHPDGADCGLIGALGQGCGPVSVEQETWAGIKSRYRAAEK